VPSSEWFWDCRVNGQIICLELWDSMTEMYQQSHGAQGPPKFSKYLTIDPTISKSLWMKATSPPYGPIYSCPRRTVKDSGFSSNPYSSHFLSSQFSHSYFSFMHAFAVSQYLLWLLWLYSSQECDSVTSALFQRTETVCQVVTLLLIWALFQRLRQSVSLSASYFKQNLLLCVSSLMKILLQG